MKMKNFRMSDNLSDRLKFFILNSGVHSGLYTPFSAPPISACRTGAEKNADGAYFP